MNDIVWNTKDSEGNLVGTGVYIWRLSLQFKDGHVKQRFFKMGILRSTDNADGTCIIESK